VATYWIEINEPKRILRGENIMEKIDKDKQDLQTKYKNLNDEELIAITTVDKNDYTPKGVELARLELANRNIGIEQQKKMAETITSKRELTQVYPWRRYWARLFDISFIMPIYIILIALFYPRLNYSITRMDSFIGGTLLLLFYLIFFEPMMLSSFGTTPGKALLGIKIRDLSGNKISYTTGMKRGFLVWLNGMGIGIPLITLFTMIAAYNRLKRNGITSWDEKCGINIIHHRISILRVILFIVIFIFCLFILGALLNM